MSFWTQNMGSGSVVGGGGSTTPGRSPIIQIPLSQFSTALSSPYSAPSYPTKASTPMETESIRSGLSDRSKRSNAIRSPGSGTGHHHRSRRSHSHKSGRGDRSTTGSHKGGGDSRDGDEVIEVQILPQDDNWGENTTVVTGNTSDHSVSMDDMSKLGKDYNEQGATFKCHMWVGSVVASIISIFAFISPILMVILPKLELFNWKIVKTCGPECDGILISFAFKLLILLVGSWALFLRKPRATMPRIFVFRAIILSLIFVFTFSYWLFYAVRVMESQKKDPQYPVTYYSVLLFAVSLVDALLFIHYLAVILMEIRQAQPQYMLKVVRSPDGESHSYNIGQLSIQRAAVVVLEHYYQNFSVYNPYLERLPTKSSRKSASQIKFYDVDGGGVTSTGSQIGDHSSPRHSSRRGRDISSHNERFYEEQEYERRVRKRRARLISATEEAFTHIRRLNNDPGPAQPMDPGEAAQAVFPSLARSLQKYLRITRQQPQHTVQSILGHLALCLSHDLSPKAFLEKYMKTSPVAQNDREHKPVQTWALVCDILLSRALQDNMVFQLRQNDISLLVTVHKIPHFNITEEIIDPKSNKFVLRLNSETSV